MRRQCVARAKIAAALLAAVGNCCVAAVTAVLFVTAFMLTGLLAALRGMPQGSHVNTGTCMYMFAGLPIELHTGIYLGWLHHLLITQVTGYGVHGYGDAFMDMDIIIG